MLNNNFGKDDNITSRVLSLYSVAEVLLVRIWLLTSTYKEFHKWDAGFFIYTPVAQQLSLLSSLIFDVRVSFVECTYPFIP